MSTFQSVLFGAAGVVILLLLSMLDLSSGIKRRQDKRRQL